MRNQLFADPFFAAVLGYILSGMTQGGYQPACPFLAIDRTLRSYFLSPNGLFMSLPVQPFENAVVAATVVVAAVVTVVQPFVMWFVLSSEKFKFLLFFCLLNHPRSFHALLVCRCV